MVFPSFPTGFLRKVRIQSPNETDGPWFPHSLFSQGADLKRQAFLEALALAEAAPGVST